MDTSFNSNASSDVGHHAPKGLSRAQSLQEIGKYTGSYNKKPEEENDDQSQRSFAILESTQSTVSFGSRSFEFTPDKSKVSEGVFTQQIQKRNVDFQFTPESSQPLSSQPLCPNTLDISTQGISFTTMT